MDQGNMSPMGAIPAKKNSGTTVMIMIIVIIVLLAMYLSMRSKSTDLSNNTVPLNESQQSDPIDEIPATIESTVPTTIEAEATAGFSASDDITSIEEDLKTTDTNIK